MVLYHLFFLLCTTIRQRLRVLTYLFFLYAHNHFIKIWGPLPFIITFVHDHSTKKIRVLIYIFISFVHDHSTKIRGHSYSLIYSLMNCVYISYATFIAVLIYFVHYIQDKTALIFRTLCPWLYEVLFYFCCCFLVEADLVMLSIECGVGIVLSMPASCSADFIHLARMSLKAGLYGFYVVMNKQVLLHLSDLVTS